jgi:serine/threonine protein kinase
MAPEVLAQLGHGFCVDYWGLGMIVYEMMTGLPPWYTTDRAQLFRRLKSAPLDIPTYFSPSAASCVSALLQRNPRQRLGVTGIRTAMEHEFFRNISWRALYSRRVEAPVRPCEGWKPPDPVREDLVSTDSTRPTYPDGVAKLDSDELDTATQNFDNQFLRMPVESEDEHSASFDHTNPEEKELLEDLDENTFLGFTFDMVKNKEDLASTIGPTSANATGHRTQHYHPGHAE